MSRRITRAAPVAVIVVLMTRASAVAVAIVLTVLLAGCSSIDHGTVTDKHAYSAYWTTICSSTGKSVICFPSYRGPSWRLDLRSSDQTGWVYVSEATYDRYAVGSVYP